MPDEIDSVRLGKFTQRLRQSKRRWVDTDTLWSAFAAAFPTLAHATDRRSWMLHALEELARQQLIKLPRPNGNRWDRSLRPAVPTSVYLLRRPELPKNNDWKAFPWHPRLRWVSELPRLTAELEEFLLRVHYGLVRDEFRDRAPLKYRSLQLTGREKRLGELAQTSLFAEGRLDLQLLGCFAETPPLALERLSDAPTIVIFENADSFAVARNVLRTLGNLPYGMVGFGGGNGIARSLPSLAMLSIQLRRIAYVGDLDLHGLRIAARAVRAAARAGLPRVEPATELHLAMLASARQFGHHQGWKDYATQRPPVDKLPILLEFVDEIVRMDLAHILSIGHRIPEEVLGPRELLATWA